MNKCFALSLACAFAFVSSQSARADVLAESLTSNEYADPLFHRLAKEVTFFPINSFIYDRDDFSFGPKFPDDAPRYAKLKQLLSREQDSVLTLQNLLRDDDAKVRTLALAALFTKDDPHDFLPYLASSADNDAPTFDGHSELSETWLQMTGIGPPQKEQTVGYIARKMLAFYMTRSGFYNGYDGCSGFNQEEVVLENSPTIRYQRATGREPGFVEYWNERKNRIFCVSWFEAQFERAREGTSPIPDTAAPKFRALRERINKLPRDDRNWTILGLHAADDGFALWSEAEVVAACKELGDTKLMLMLQNRIPSDDPDLQLGASGNNGRVLRMREFVLKYASQLLRAKQANTLLTQETADRRGQNENSLISAAWAIAAADLRPAQSKTILYNAWKRFQGKYEGDERTNLVLALLDKGGNAEVDFAHQWIFKQPQQPYTVPGTVGLLFGRMEDTKNKNSQALAAAVIADARLDTLNLKTLRELILLVNSWLPEPIASLQDMYPRNGEAEEIALMAEWRQKLRASTLQWNKAPKI